MKTLLFFLLLSLTAQSQVWETTDLRYIPIEVDPSNTGRPDCEHEWYYDLGEVSDTTVLKQGAPTRIVIVDTVYTSDMTRYVYCRTYWAICSVCLRHERFAWSELQTLNPRKPSYAILKTRLR